MRERTRYVLIAVVLAIFMSACLCNGDEEVEEKVERWEEPAVTERVEEKVEEKKAAPEQVEGATFNALFPADQTEGYTRTFTQEKAGYAEAVYAHDDGQEIKIAIADVIDQIDTRKKYAEATEEIGAYPMMTRGKNSSMVLVEDRYQIKISSKEVDAVGRRAWLEKVDLKGLAAKAD